MEIMKDSDYTQIVNTLENKIPQDKIRKIVMDIKKASDLQDHWDSPYTRPTFAKVLLLFILIISLFIWMIMPVYKLLFSSTTIKAQVEEIITDRKQLTSESFSFVIVLEKTISDKPILSVYDRNERELLAKSDVINNKAYVVTSKIDWETISSAEINALSKTQADLSEDIKDDVISILNKNISVEDSYLDFKSLDYWVDQVINLKE